MLVRQAMLLRQDSLPPSYAVATLNEPLAPAYQEITERAPGFQYFQRTRHYIKIFDALDSNEPHYLMAETHELDNTNIRFYRGSDRNRPASGQAIFSKATKDFVIAVDGPASFAFPEHELVQCINSHNYFRTDIYRFVVPGGSYLEQEHRTLVWKHTHNSNLGSAAWKAKDFKLINEATEQTIAIYIHMSESKNVTGRLEWKVPYSFNEEIRALIVLMAFLIRT
jgi:hypothetical protein